MDNTKIVDSSWVITDMRSFWGTVKYYWQVHIIVALCTAVATGVLAGAMIVGDSMRSSLRNITLERLGNIQQALLADHFFKPDIIDRQDTVPAILLNGTVVAAGTEARASKVNIYGIDNNFFSLWDTQATSNLSSDTNKPFADIVINDALQNELNAQVGDAILVHFPKAVEIHPDFLLGTRDVTENIKKLRLIISDIVQTENAGRFSLNANQSLPLNAYISLPVLQKALTQTGKVNCLFTADSNPISIDKLSFSLQDVGLNLSVHETVMDLQSKQFLLEPVFSEAAKTVAYENNIPFLPTFTYLAKTITGADIGQNDVPTNNTQIIPYSTILALPIDIGEFAELVNRNTTDAEKTALKNKLETQNTSIQPASIILNSWAADNLNVKVGEAISITYYSVTAQENWTTKDNKPESEFPRTKKAQFILTGIVPIESIAADTNLIPAFPGIHDTKDISEWEPPFAIDYSLIRNVDEDYWDEYKTTPKAFISLETGKRLWKNRFGDLTTIRMGPASGLDIAATKLLFETEFLKKINPEQIGFQMLNLREEGLNASKGSTDFGMLFSSLSMFIIAAVAGLIGIVFRIGVQQRAREIGILQAVGWTLTKIRNRFLGEGIFIACIGSLFGCLFAIGYAQIMIFGLKTWWLPAIGTPFLNLHVNVVSILIGLLISLVVVILTIRLTMRRLGKLSTVSLLTGQTDFSHVVPKTTLENKKHSGFSTVGHRSSRLLGIGLTISGFIVGFLVEGEFRTKGWVGIIVLIGLTISILLGFGNATQSVRSSLKKPVKIILLLFFVCIGFGVGTSLRYVPFLNSISEDIFTLLSHPIVQFISLTFSVLVLGWVVFGKWLKSEKDYRRSEQKRMSRMQFALKNAGRQPERSIASVITISLACCIIVAVGVNRQDAPPETEYAFVAESVLPIHHNLNTQTSRLELGFDEKNSKLLASSEIVPFRVLPGEDVSCLNLYKPTKPQILGASTDMLNDELWHKLKAVVENQGSVGGHRSSRLPEEEGKIHAIGDENSLRWILKHNPKDDFLIQDEFGKTVRLTLQTVKNSLFQSQLIISESNFTKYFPSQSGYQFFLIKTPPELREDTRLVLEKTLQDYGFDVTLASERLTNFRAVQNTYISTFQSLGGLGVLLGTFGLALILFRNIIERRGELATLRAFGFRRKLLSKMLFFESCFILMIGMFIGIAAGLIAILGSQGHLPAFPSFSLAITLLFIFVFGIIANSIAVNVALRSPLLSTLKMD